MKPIVAAIEVGDGGGEGVGHILGEVGSGEEGWDGRWSG